MESGFESFCTKDLVLARQLQEGLVKIDPELEKMLYAGLKQTLTELTVEIPRTTEVETIIRATPVGQMAEPLKGEAGRRALKGESAADLPRVTAVESPKGEPVKKIGRLRVFFFIPSDPDILADKSIFTRAISFLTSVAGLNEKKLAQIQPEIRVGAGGIETHLVILKQGQAGTRLIELGQEEPVADYVKQSWQKLDKPVGIAAVDQEMEYASYLARQKATAGEIPGTVDLFIQTLEMSNHGFVSNHGDANRTSLATYYGSLFGTRFLFLPFSKWWNEDWQHLTLDEEGTVYLSKEKSQ